MNYWTILNIQRRGIPDAPEFLTRSLGRTRRPRYRFAQCAGHSPRMGTDSFLLSALDPIVSRSGRVGLWVSAVSGFILCTAPKEMGARSPVEKAADGPSPTQKPEGLLCYFSSRRPPTSSRIRICWMAISLSFRNRADCGMPSLIMTALMFSMFERQISWFTVA